MTIVSLVYTLSYYETSEVDPPDELIQIMVDTEIYNTGIVISGKDIIVPKNLIYFRNNRCSEWSPFSTISTAFKYASFDTISSKYTYTLGNSKCCGCGEVSNITTIIQGLLNDMSDFVTKCNCADQVIEYHPLILSISELKTEEKYFLLEEEVFRQEESKFEKAKEIFYEAKHRHSNARRRHGRIEKCYARAAAT